MFLWFHSQPRCNYVSCLSDSGNLLKLEMMDLWPRRDCCSTQQARFPSLISAFPFLLYSLGVLPSRDRAFRNSSNINKEEQ